MIQQNNDTPIIEPIHKPNRLNFVKNDNFYIYGEVDDTFPENIIEPLTAAINSRIALSSASPLQFYISSPGGSVYYALEVIELIELAKKFNIPVVSYVYSNACSAASLIAVSAAHRYAGRYAAHLLHYIRNFDYDHNPVMADRNHEYNKFLQGTILDIYTKNTKLKKAALQKLLIADNYMVYGNDLIKFGLVDEIL